MTSKKPAAPKRTAAKAKTVTVPSVGSDPASRRVWTLPIAMLMLVVGAGGLWLAARESANAPQAAAAAVIAPDEPADTSHTVSARSEKRTVATPAAAAKDSETATLRATAKPSSISGCLQKADGGFVLKNTEGSDAPRSRSWKTGFFRKSAASVDLLDASNAAHLAQHVGQRVSVTGSLVDREMAVQSLRRLAATCE